MSSTKQAKAAAEVKTWKIHPKSLKPALITREHLWKTYEDKNNDWSASVAEMGMSAASSVLTGSAGLTAIQMVANIIAEKTQGDLLDMTLEKGIDRIAGAYVTQYDPAKNYKLSADKKLATKFASGFVTILVAAAGGALTVWTAGGAAAVTAIALVVWYDENNKAKELQRWNTIVDNILDQYHNSRERKLQEINDKHVAELERNVMSNADHDAHDDGHVGFYRYKKGTRTFIAKYEKAKLQNILQYLETVDERLAWELVDIDVFELIRHFSWATLELWAKIHAEEKRLAQEKKVSQKKQTAETLPKVSNSKSNDDRVRDFMRRQVEGHVEDGKVLIPDMKKDLKVVNDNALKDYNPVPDILKIGDEEEVKDSDERTANEPPKFNDLKLMGAVTGSRKVGSA